MKLIMQWPLSASALLFVAYVYGGFGAALLGSLVYTAIGLVIGSALGRLFPK